MAVGEFRMPSLGADMDSGTLLEWLVAPGDTVHRGDIVAVVDTAKSAIEVEVFEDGQIGELLVEPGTVVPVGTPLATIESAAAGAEEPEPRAKPAKPRPEAASEKAAGEAATPVATGMAENVSEEGATQARTLTAEPAAPQEEATGAPHPAPDIAEPSVTSLARLASPPVRHLAAQRGVDLAHVRGTGEDGRITRDDVERASGAPARAERAPQAAQPRRRVTPRARRLATQRGIDLASVPGDTVTGADIPQAGAAEPAPRRTIDRRETMRQTTAALMARAAREIPHYYVTRTMDVRPMVQWLSAHNADLPVRQRVLPIAVLLRAVTAAAVAVPELNGHWIDDAFAPGDGIHLGIATATRGGGLVTPALRDAQNDDIDALMARLTDLVRRARKGTLRSSEIAPGTITVSSLVDGGPDALYGVIYPPQVALVGIGAITERPWAVDGMLTVRPTLTITLAADHRATDGRTGAGFLQTLTDALRDPEAL
jgi:pyruvate dehydrogenase E2 component (dihydrolipoamide acetyltransferase)